MQLGNFSVSLAVKDIEASLDFYQKLGFEVLARPAPNYAILQNDTCTIGLFQGKLDKNILTFNPGWDRGAKPLADFDDVRDIQAELQRRGVTPAVGADPASTGPASVIVVDPDGNQILLDQHVGRPGG